MQIETVLRIGGYSVVGLLVLTVVLVIVSKWQPRVILSPFNAVIKTLVSSKRFMTADEMRELFPECTELEKRHREILEEYNNADSPTARTFGKNTSAKYPLLSSILGGSKAINAEIITLEPYTRIPFRKGFYSGYLRYYLPLNANSNTDSDIYVRVGQEPNVQTFVLQEGKSIMFDDAFGYEDGNNSNSRSILLVIDVERRIKSRILNKINRGILKLVEKLKYQTPTFTALPTQPYLHVKNELYQRPL